MAQVSRSESLERTLKTLHIAVDGVKASVIVNVDGLLRAEALGATISEQGTPWFHGVTPVRDVGHRA